MRRKTDFWLGLWTLCFVAATAGIAYFSPLTPRQLEATQPINLQVTDDGGRLRIDWDKNHDVIRTASGATLEVDDGGVTNRYPVEPQTLRAGGFDYIRKTPDVLLTLTLFHDGKPDAVAKIRSIGPLQSAAAVPKNGRQEQRRTRRR